MFALKGMMGANDAIGIVFNIDDLGGYYSYSAMKIIMKHLDPEKLKNTIIQQGDSAETLAGQRNEFILAFHGSTEQVEYIRNTFKDADIKGLAPKLRRFLVRERLMGQRLVQYGTIDVLGALVTHQWNRTDHDLCKEFKWMYNPLSGYHDLSPDLAEELEKMRLPSFD